MGLLGHRTSLLQRFGAIWRSPQASRSRVRIILILGRRGCCCPVLPFEFAEKLYSTNSSVDSARNPSSHSFMI